MQSRGIIAIIVAIAVMALSPFAYPWLEPARLFYNVHGIDVSHHQGQIDWHAVATDGVSFAYIKSTEGGDFVDPRFAQNWRASKAAGVKRGGYHFFTQCRSGEQQARNFIRTVPVDRAALAHAVDAEHMGPCKKSAAVRDIVKELGSFLTLVEKHYGRRPIIYTTREFHDAYLVTHFTQERFWIRSLVLPPRFRKQQWDIWQYHNRGRRAGISGPVDLNVRHPAPQR